MAAPKGNKFAIGNNGGAPAMYDKPEDMTPLLESFVEEHLGTDDKSGERFLKKMPTITGLALHLGFSDKSSIYDYEKKNEFAHLIKRARLFVEYGYENQLHGRNPTGAIFVLKNMGWLDESKVVNINKEAKPLTDEQIQKLNKKLDDEY